VAEAEVMFSAADAASGCGLPLQTTLFQTQGSAAS
jgi:hypothetical protein